jgi:histidyl-tRNA synthetase
VILPNLWEQSTFTAKAGPEILGQMYAFKDKGNRDICLVPEATAIIQEQFNASWGCTWPKPIRLFYVQRCYRYDRPQKGRYREFTQIGVELLEGNPPADKAEVTDLLQQTLQLFPIRYEMKDGVRRGLSYYVEDGFEVEVASLGAQKQVAGGGRYREGIGWAIGLDRLILALGSLEREA